MTAKSWALPAFKFHAGRHDEPLPIHMANRVSINPECRRRGGYNIGTWRIAPTGKMPTGRAGLGAAQSGWRIYVIGGNDAAGQYYREVLSARFDFGKP